MPHPLHTPAPAHAHAPDLRETATGALACIALGMLAALAGTVVYLIGDAAALDALAATYPPR